MRCKTASGFAFFVHAITCNNKILFSIQKLLRIGNSQFKAKPLGAEGTHKIEVWLAMGDTVAIRLRSGSSAGNSGNLPPCLQREYTIRLPLSEICKFSECFMSYALHPWG